MNILVIAPTPYFSDRGCHIRILEELKALKCAGHNPTLFTYHLGRDEGPVPVQRSLNIPWYKKTSAGPSWHRLYLDILLWWHIQRTCRHLKFDIIHAHLHEGAWIGWMIKRKIKKPLILDAQGSLTEEMIRYNYIKRPFLKHWFWRLERWLVLHADHVFVSSQDLLNFMHNKFPEVKHRISLLIDAIPAHGFTMPSAEQRTALLNNLQLDANRPIVIYTGGLTKIKGLDYLLEAIPKVMQEHPATQFLIIGHPLTYCQQRLAQLGLTTTVKLIGQVPYVDLPQYLALADIAVDPKPANTGESSGKILNYMAMGLPVVAFHSKNTTTTLNNAGIIVEPETSAALAKQINRLIDNSALRKQLGSIAKERVLKHYSWNAIIQHAVATYEQLSH